MDLAHFPENSITRPSGTVCGYFPQGDFWTANNFRFARYPPTIRVILLEMQQHFGCGDGGSLQCLDNSGAKAIDDCKGMSELGLREERR